MENNANGGLWKNVCFRATVYIILIISGILLISLLPASFSSVEYYQTAVKRNVITQNIIWDSAYGMGKWFWGVGYTPFTFQSTIQPIYLTNLSIIPTSGLEFFLDATVYYRLNTTAESLNSIFKSFGSTGYHDQATKLATGIIKNSAPAFSVDDYKGNRFYVQQVIGENITSVFAQNGLIVEDFFMLEMQFPDQILEKYLQTGVQSQNLITAYYVQNQTAIIQDTQWQVNLYLNNATYVQVTTAAEIQNMQLTANATGTNLIQSAEGRGLFYFLSKFNLTASQDIQSVIQVMAYLRKKPQFTVGDFSFFIGNTISNQVS